MAKNINRLTALKVKKSTKKGDYPDGRGLYLRVLESGSKSWFYRYEVDGKGKRHGLGSYPTTSLENARKSAEKCRQLRNDGHNPIEYNKQLKLKNQQQLVGGKTFKNCALQYIESHKGGWKNEKHQSQWRNTLSTYVYPTIGDLSVESINLEDIMEILTPIWKTKTETADRVRQRIESVLSWAKVHKYRSGDNPALWRGNLDQLLPKPRKVHKVKHHCALPYLDIPSYFIILKDKNTVIARTLAFTILTATRSSESRYAKWDEINFKDRSWLIPAERMKSEKEHRIPLTNESIKILKEQKKIKVDNFIFAGSRKNRPVSDGGVLKLAKQITPKITVHGFRSTFKDWTAETTTHAFEIEEAALAHVIGNKTVAAYQRGDLFDKRRKLMNDWDRYCLSGK